MATPLIDDQRDLPADRVARTFKEGIEALREQHWDLLYSGDALGCYHLGVAYDQGLGIAQDRIRAASTTARHVMQAT